MEKRNERIPESHFLFGMRIKQLRIERGMTQGQLGAIIGMDRSFISKIESGQGNASLETIVRIAHGLSVPPAELFSNINRETMKAPALRR